MKTLKSIATAGMTAFLFAALFTSAANARCKVAGMSKFRSSSRTLPNFAMKQPAAPALPMDATATTPEPSIAGYWYVQFSVDKQLVDDGFDQWHSDGTELLNDTSPVLAGNVCLGVWAKTDTLTYVLKHPTWFYDDAGVNVIGVGIIREQIKLDPSGNSYTGTSTIDAYDLAGNPIFHADSDLTGTRINAVDDPKAPMTPIPGLPAAILNRASVNQ